METKEILRKLVSFNTIRDNQNKEIMDYLEEYLKEYGFSTKRVNKCLIAYNDLKPNIGFLGHTDTVDFESWDASPLELVENGDKLIGLGACDMKGGIAAILSAISDIDLNKNKIALYFTNDEEIGFKGIKDIKDYIVPNNIIIGEPTDNIPIYGTKGLLELEIEFYGVKCHSSTPDNGVSAIYECISFIDKIKEYYETVIKTNICNDFEDIPYTTMNVGMINGGETINSVPGLCKVTMDFRIANKEDINLLENKIKELLKDYNSKLNILNKIEPKINNSDISFIEKISYKKQSKSYLTEGSFIDKNFIILGPGPNTAHQKNEYIYKSSLLKTKELYEEIIKFYNEEEI